MPILDAQMHSYERDHPASGQAPGCLFDRRATERRRACGADGRYLGAGLWLVGSGLVGSGLIGTLGSDFASSAGCCHSAVNFGDDFE